MNDQKAQLVDKLKNATNVLVTVSTDPSIDQLASCIALTLLVNKIQKQGTAVFSGKVPPVMQFLKPEETLQSTPDSLRDFIISLDKSKADKLRYKVEDDVVKIFITPYHTSLSEKDLEFAPGDFNVDVIVALGVHHQQDLDGAITAHGRIFHDAVVLSINNTPDGDLGVANWQDLEASSLSELIAELAPELGENLLDEQIATALLTGIVAETSRFSNGKTHPRTMSVGSALLAAGANQQLVAEQLQTITNGAAAPALPGAAPAALPEVASPETASSDSSDAPNELVIGKDGRLQLPGEAPGSDGNTPTDSTASDKPVESAATPDTPLSDGSTEGEHLSDTPLQPEAGAQPASEQVGQPGNSADNNTHHPADTVSTPESPQSQADSSQDQTAPAQGAAATPADPPADLFKTPAPQAATQNPGNESPLTEPLGTPFDGLAPPPGIADQFGLNQNTNSNTQPGGPNKTLAELENDLNRQNNQPETNVVAAAPDNAPTPSSPQQGTTDDVVDDAEAARRAVNEALQASSNDGPSEDLNAQEVDLGLEHNQPQETSPEAPTDPGIQMPPPIAPPQPDQAMPDSNLQSANPEAAAAMSPLIQPIPSNQPSYANPATTTEYVTPQNQTNEPAPLGMSPADQPFTMPLPPAGPPSQMMPPTPGTQPGPGPFGSAPATPPPSAAPPVPPPMMPGYGPQQNQ